MGGIPALPNFCLDCPPSTRSAGFPALALAAIAPTGWELLVLLVLVLLVQQLWIYLTARCSAKPEELFRIITENAVDMIALVNVGPLPLQQSCLPQSPWLYRSRACRDTDLRAGSPRGSFESFRSVSAGASHRHRPKPAISIASQRGVLARPRVHSARNQRPGRDGEPQPDLSSSLAAQTSGDHYRHRRLREWGYLAR
jgi:hypothetical protein